MNSCEASKRSDSYVIIHCCTEFHVHQMIPCIVNNSQYIRFKDSQMQNVRFVKWFSFCLYLFWLNRINRIRTYSHMFRYRIINFRLRNSLRLFSPECLKLFAVHCTWNDLWVSKRGYKELFIIQIRYAKFKMQGWRSGGIEDCGLWNVKMRENSSTCAYVLL